jgi:hypothetical protein
MTRIKFTKRFKVSSTQGVIRLQVDSIIPQDNIPGKRKSDFDHPMQLDAKPAAGISSTLKMKPQSDDDHDDSTLDVDYTAHPTCCLHCPLLKTYLQLHGEWPTEPATNQVAKTL